MKKRKLTTEVIKASSHISREIKIDLDKCPTQEVRSIPLTEWTRELVRIARKHRYSDKEITKWIKAYGREGNWSERQISYVISNEIR